MIIDEGPRRYRPRRVARWGGAGRLRVITHPGSGLGQRAEATWQKYMTGDITKPAATLLSSGRSAKSIWRKSREQYRPIGESDPAEVLEDTTNQCMEGVRSSDHGSAIASGRSNQTLPTPRLRKSSPCWSTQRSGALLSGDGTNSNRQRVDRRLRLFLRKEKGQSQRRAGKSD